MRIPMSPAAAGLLRALLSRAGVDRDRILLTEFRSVDWQSLTFVGERHSFQLRVAGPDAGAVWRIMAGIDEAELDIPGHYVADIVARDEHRQEDGSIIVAFEALTLVQD